MKNSNPFFFWLFNKDLQDKNIVVYTLYTKRRVSCLVSCMSCKVTQYWVYIYAALGSVYLTAVSFIELSVSLTAVSCMEMSVYHSSVACIKMTVWLNSDWRLWKKLQHIHCVHLSTQAAGHFGQLSTRPNTSYEDISYNLYE